MRGELLRVSKRVTQREQSSHIYPRQQAGIKLQRNRFAFGEEKYSEFNIGKILYLGKALAAKKSDRNCAVTHLLN